MIVVNGCVVGDGDCFFYVVLCVLGVRMGEVDSIFCLKEPTIVQEGMNTKQSCWDKWFEQRFNHLFLID